MQLQVKSANVMETRKIAIQLAEAIKEENKTQLGATVISLEGDLGTGKTTFIQAFGKAFGIKKRMLSPTFVLRRDYAILRNYYSKLIHLDLYRTHDAKTLRQIGWKSILGFNDYIVLIEWGNLILKSLPPNTIHVVMRHDGGNKRHINFKFL